MTSTEELHAYLSELDDEAVHALVPLDESHAYLRTADEQQLHDILERIEAEKAKGRAETPVPDDMLDSFVSLTNAVKTEEVIDPAVVENAIEIEATNEKSMKSISQFELGESMEMPSSTNSVVVLFVACGLALVVACLFGLILYIFESSRRPRESMQGYLLSKLELGQSGFTDFSPGPSRTARTIIVEEKPPLLNVLAPEQSIVAKESSQESTQTDSDSSVKPLIIFDDLDVESVYDSADEDFDEKDYEVEPMSVYATPLLQGLSLSSDDEDEIDIPAPDLFQLPALLCPDTKPSPLPLGERGSCSPMVVEDESEVKTPKQFVFTSPCRSPLLESPKKRRIGTPSITPVEGMSEGRTVPAWAALAALATQSPTRYPSSLTSSFAPSSPSPDSKLRLRSHARSKSSALVTPTSTPFCSRPSTPAPLLSSTSSSSTPESEGESDVIKAIGAGPAPPAPARRAFAAYPEMDAVALGMMQLRPVLGMDPTWLLRFVVTLFGWCAVWVSGSGR